MIYARYILSMPARSLVSNLNAKNIIISLIRILLACSMSQVDPQKNNNYWEKASSQQHLTVITVRWEDYIRSSSLHYIWSKLWSSIQHSNDILKTIIWNWTRSFFRYASWPLIMTIIDVKNGEKKLQVLEI